MKKIIVLCVLAVMLIVGSLVCFAYGEESSVCPECELYTYAAVLPYLTASDSGWWTGLAITNTTSDDVLCRIDYVGDNSVERVDIAPRSIKTFVTELNSTSYANVRSTAPLYVTVLIADGKQMQGYNKQLTLIDPAAPATETEVAR